MQSPWTRLLAAGTAVALSACLLVIGPTPWLAPLAIVTLFVSPALLMGLAVGADPTPRLIGWASFLAASIGLNVLTGVALGRSPVGLSHESLGTANLLLLGFMAGVIAWRGWRCWKDNPQAGDAMPRHQARASWLPAVVVALVPAMLALLFITASPSKEGRFVEFYITATQSDSVSTIPVVFSPSDDIMLDVHVKTTGLPNAEWQLDVLMNEHLVDRLELETFRGETVVPVRVPTQSVIGSRVRVELELSRRDGAQPPQRIWLVLDRAG